MRAPAAVRRSIVLVALSALAACGEGDVEIRVSGASPTAGPTTTASPGGIPGLTDLPGIPELADIPDLQALTEGQARVDITGDVDTSFEAGISSPSGVSPTAGGTLIFVDSGGNTVTVAGLFRTGGAQETSPTLIVSIVFAQPTAVYVSYAGECTVTFDELGEQLIEGSLECEGLQAGGSTIDASGTFSASA